MEMDKLPSTNISAGNSTVNRRLFLERSGYQHLDQEDLRVLIPVVLGIICVLGFTGNVTAIGVLITNARKGKLSIVNALILNLMLADGLVLAFAVPFKAAAYSRATWTLGLFVCKTCDWFLHSCMAAKSFTVAIMAKACYRYVSNPTKQVSIRLKTILVALLFAWLLACVVPIPQWLFASLQREAGGVICVQSVPSDAHDFMSVYVKAYPLVAYCTPLSFALLYFWKAYGRCQHRSSKTQNLRTQIRSRKLTLMLFILTVAMAILWLPQWVSWVWMRHAFETDGIFPPVIFTLSAQLLMFSISLVNPLIILALSEEFREGYIDLWRRLTLRKQPAKHKPGPHTPSAPKSPTPRPETSAHLPPHQSEQTPEKETNQSAGEESLSNKDGIVLQDVEQFWHERESGSQLHENDPVPWENQDLAEGKQ